MYYFNTVSPPIILLYNTFIIFCFISNGLYVLFQHRLSPNYITLQHFYHTFFISNGLYVLFQHRLTPNYITLQQLYHTFSFLIYYMCKHALLAMCGSILMYAHRALSIRTGRHFVRPHKITNKTRFSIEVDFSFCPLLVLQQSRAPTCFFIWINNNPVWSINMNIPSTFIHHSP